MPRADGGLLTGDNKRAELDDVKGCKRGYVWSSKKKRCVRAAGDASDEDCFVTTACCGAIGLADDCFELNELRLFREKSMRPNERGRGLIDEYSIVGPELLINIPDDIRFLVLCKFYSFYVLPCVVLSKLGLNGVVVKIYAFGALRLLKKYAPNVYASRKHYWKQLPA
jgi:hypothetical protein